MHKQQHFHFVGINGIGMSGIAKILHKKGYIISGCDLSCDHANIQELVDADCKISSQHNSALCNDDSITTIVYSSDVPYNSPELVNARNKGIATIQRAAALAEIMQSKYSIGVAGSHGKTTTTSMIAHIFIEAQTDPTIIVGGIMHNINNNARYGQGDYLIAETDESDRSHLLLPVTVGVLTSVDFEHANVYKNLDEVVAVFTQFLNQIPHHGKAIVCVDDDNISNMSPIFYLKVITYGTKKFADIQPINIQLHPDSSSFDIFDSRTQTVLGSININMPSIYNVLNATAAITTALEQAIPFSVIAQALASFQGVDRRFSYKGTMQSPSAEIFDDYGHHPTEIYHSLITARRKTKNKLIVVFQPQRYTRTFHLWDEFVRVFQTADIDHLIITDIYTANEPAIQNVTSQRLAQEIRNSNPSYQVHYVPFQADLGDIRKNVLNITDDDDLILLLGAGKVNKLAEKLL
ncbi:MAG: UDP-N-acetylmuramate--L-alanine ligase [Candidatus Chromulinivorax sp.]|nr:UDP-N-acetylmuramate--L-alanine ligase [Candidatus Chromulinivorax sp.]